MIILGADVGSRNYGLAIIEATPKKQKYLFSESLYLEQSHIGKRLITLEDRIEFLLTGGLTDPVEYISYEIPFLRGANQAGVLYCTGVLHKLSAKYDLPISHYTATEVKKTVSGSGKADKKELELATRKALDIDDSVDLGKDHATDAIAIALCHHLKTTS